MNNSDITLLVYGIADLTEMTKEAANHWGNRTPMMVIEEMAELTKAISKFERRHDKESFNNMKEEIRDVLISIGMLSNHYYDVFGEIERRESSDGAIWADEIAEMIVDKLSEKKDK